MILALVFLKSIVNIVKSLKKGEKMRRLQSILLMAVMVIGLTCVPSKSVKAMECVDGSYLTEDDCSEGEAEMIPRGMYLKSGTSSISEVGTGKIAAGGRTVGQMVVSKISVTVKVERLVNGSWASYTSWSEEKSNAALVSSSKTLTVPIGYYYRVYCRHYANTDASGSYTDGIQI